MNINIHGKVLSWSDNISDDFEQIRHFAKSSAKSYRPFAFREHCTNNFPEAIEVIWKFQFAPIQVLWLLRNVAHGTIVVWYTIWYTAMELHWNQISIGRTNPDIVSGVNDKINVLNLYFKTPCCCFKQCKNFNGNARIRKCEPINLTWGKFYFKN